MELHHIDPDGPDTAENCIPLCFNCHAEAGSYNPAHPKGRKLTFSEIKGHRDRWYQSVREGKHLSNAVTYPDEKVMLKYELKNFQNEDFPVFVVEVINSGRCDLYVKQVLLGWRFAAQTKGESSHIILNASENWKTALPPGLSREYRESIAAFLFSHGKEFQPLDDVWISVETPKGEIQKVIGLRMMFSSRLLVMQWSRMHIVGKSLYPT